MSSQWFFQQRFVFYRPQQNPLEHPDRKGGEGGNNENPEDPREALKKLRKATEQPKYPGPLYAQVPDAKAKRRIYDAGPGQKNPYPDYNATLPDTKYEVPEELTDPERVKLYALKPEQWDALVAKLTDIAEREYWTPVRAENPDNLSYHSANYMGIVMGLPEDMTTRAIAQNWTEQSLVDKFTTAVRIYRDRSIGNDTGEWYKPWRWDPTRGFREWWDSPVTPLQGENPWLTERPNHIITKERLRELLKKSAEWKKKYWDDVLAGERAAIGDKEFGYKYNPVVLQFIEEHQLPNLGRNIIDAYVVAPPEGKDYDELVAQMEQDYAGASTELLNGAMRSAEETDLLRRLDEEKEKANMEDEVKDSEDKVEELRKKAEELFEEAKKTVKDPAKAEELRKKAEKKIQEAVKLEKWIDDLKKKIEDLRK